MRGSHGAWIILALLCAAGLARAEPSPLNAWATGAYLSRSADSKAVPSVQALDELFASVVGATDGAPTALAGLLNLQQLAEERPDAVVVVASTAGACSSAVSAQLAELTGTATSNLQLPNAMHEGDNHPVFAGLRRSARHMHVEVLGACGFSMAGAGPATAAALRAELEGVASRDKPTVVIVCPRVAAAAEARDEEAELLAAAAQLLAELVPKHLLVHTSHTALAAAHSQHDLQRRLLAASNGAAANRTLNYTVCDATCQKHVMWFQGLIVLVVILMALCVGCSCMHMLDVPTRFAQPEASRTHQD